MNKDQDEAQAHLIMVRGVVAGLTKEDQAKVEAAAEAIAATMSNIGDEGMIALALVGAEIAAGKVRTIKPKDAAVQSQALSEVLAERCRQVEAEKFTHEHDDTEIHGQLAHAAACYAMPIMLEVAGCCGFAGRVPLGWPWLPHHWKPKDRRRDLVRACALLIAELERMDRAAAKAVKP